MSDTPETDAAWAAWPYAGPGVHANFARKLERERDEARKEVETLETRHAAVMLHSQGVVDENTELRAEVEQLKADKARLDWLGVCFENRVNKLIYEHMADDIRAAIDAAMKGPRP